MTDPLTKYDVLSQSTFGQRVAEDEGDALTRYFVETDHWKRLISGDVDVVYGMKGAGKSALYSLLWARRNDLFDRSIILAPAENPRGAPAFRGLVADPPATEREFVGLWKLYVASLACSVLDEYQVATSDADSLRGALQREGLIRGGRSLASLLRSVFDYAKGALRPSGVEAGMNVDPLTSLPTGFTGKITFHEPSPAGKAEGYVSVDALLESADKALEASDVVLWILLDRLDVAFVESPDLEKNALRALFHVYLDLLGFEHIKLKIFLRTDIWRRITDEGFREASHITRHLTISWDRKSLMNLVVSRAIQNEPIQQFYEARPEDVLGSMENQTRFFYQMAPQQVDVGPNKSETFDWMLNRTKDGSNQTAPRELIHLLNSLREVQIRRLEVGEPAGDGAELFARGAFKEALVEVSRARLEQTLYAEYPKLKPRLESLRGEKTLQTQGSLAAIWKCSDSEALSVAQELVEVGFFERRGTKEAPEFWVPFLYREALDLVQGAAE